jgi:uncharacterized protein (DUF488 family)
MAPILTIGHSTRPIEEFAALLKLNQVTLLVDIRTIPKSRHNPQYWGTALRKSLKRLGIGYAHIPELGGLRKPVPGSVNSGWRNRSFRGYADYMQTLPFRAALKHLVELAARERIAIMCAEAVPWRCHRNLVADALTVRGLRVEHIMNEKRTSPHKVTSWAQVRGGKITYPPEETAAPVKRAA